MKKEQLLLLNIIYDSIYNDSRHKHYQIVLFKVKIPTILNIWKKNNFNTRISIKNK